MHHAAQARMAPDRLHELFARAAVVNGDGKRQLVGEAEKGVEAFDLPGSADVAGLLEVEPDLADRHHPAIDRQLPQRIDVRVHRLERKMPHRGPDLAVLMSKRERGAASFEVDPHRDHPGHACSCCFLHDLGDITQLLEVEVRVDQTGGSASTTSSSRLKRASGGMSARPGASSYAPHRSMLS